METFKLNVPDRLMVMQMMPLKGSMVDMIIVRSILKKMDFTVQEIKEWDLKDEPNNLIRFDPKKDTDKDFEFEEPEIVFLRKMVDSVSEREEVSLPLLSLLDKMRLF